MKKLILLFFFLLNPKLFGFNEWEEVFAVSNLIPESIECPDSMNCFIIMSNGSKNNLYKSRDQGKTWDMIYNNFIGAKNAISMSVPDTLNIFISFFYDGIIYKSHNGGKTFEKVILDTKLSIEKIEMRNKNRGIAFTNLAYYVTFDGWKTNKKIDMLPYGIVFNPIFVNDSIVYMIYLNETAWYLSKLNIFTSETDLNYIAEKNAEILDLCIVNENLMFACGQSNGISGGSGHDAIYKSTDGGRNWSRVLDLYNDRKLNDTIRNPFGLQSIAFKDSLTGIAVGQFGKIIYTYDGGETWIYENELPENIKKNIPPTMIIRYAGTIPIIADFLGYIHRLLKDNLVPGPENKYSISGRVWDEAQGQPGIPIINGYQITMTDEIGYYKFQNLITNSYSIRAENKYFNGKNPSYYYRPYLYHPELYEIELSSDTTGFDFNAEDIRNYFVTAGNIKNKEGKAITDFEVQIGEIKVKTDTSGNYSYLKTEKKEYLIKPLKENYTFTPAFYDTNITSHSFTLNFIGEPNTGVWESTENSGFMITPNPAIDYIIIQPSEGLEPSEGYKVQIFDLLGIEIISELIHPMTQSHRMNIERLPAGVYYVKIGDKVEKFLKME